MPKFAYVVKDRQGKAYKNIIDSDNQQKVVDSLQKQNYFIVSIKELSAGIKPQSAKKKKKKKQFSHKKVKLEDLLTFSRQLATMLEAGVSLTRSLDVILSQIQSAQFFDVLSKVRQDVEKGGSLSLSLANHPKVFNQFWVSLVEVGEASGTIPVVLNKLAFYLEQQSSFRSSIVSAMVYPAILFGVVLAAISVFAFVVGPQFESVFKQMNADVPVMTQALLSTFNFVKGNFIYLAGGVGLLVFAVKKYVKTYQGQLMYEKFLYNIKSIGPIYRLIVVERFASQMSILLDSGVPILYALDIAERLVNNITCSLIVGEIKDGVKKGESLYTPMERSGFFPPMCIQMIMVGEETGELSKMLKYVSKFYQETVETFIKRISTIIEPIMLIFMGVTVGVIVIAMFMPMLDIAKMGSH